MQYFFFHDVNSLDELRRQYKKLVFEHHPDKGGKTEDMQRINAEYEDLKRKVGNIRENAEGKTYRTEDHAKDYSDQFRKIINEIISFNCKIELCGSWLWVFGAFAYKDKLKDLGFFWCNGKKA